MTDDPAFLTAQGRRLEYAWYGDAAADGPVLVLLHEGLGCVSLWRDVPERLAAMTGRRAFAYSRAGYGRSDPCDLPRPTTYHAPEALSVLPEVLDRAGITEAVLIGHSDGGTIALMAAGRDARVRGVVTMAAHVFNEDVTLAGIRAARLAWDGTDLRDKLRRHHGDNVDLAFHGWNDTWQRPDFKDWNVERCLARVTCPVLVVQGADDQYGTGAQVEAIAQGVAGPAETLVIPGCGHAPHQESPDILLPAVARFVAAIK